MYKDINDERSKESKRKHYYNNKQQYYDRNKKAREEKWQWLQIIKSEPCMDCGESYPPYVMDFDHRDPKQKKTTISRLLTNSWNMLKTEIDKCDLVCANCHRERTWGKDS